MALLEIMQNVDPKMKVQSTVDEKTEWSNITTIPEDEEFNEHFQLKEFVYRKLKKVVVYMTMNTTLHINRIKYSNSVKEHLFQKDIWFKLNWSETKVESSPGIITMIHPKLINREDYMTEIESALRDTLCTLQDRGQEDSKQPKGFQVKTIIGERKVPPTFYLY